MTRAPIAPKAEELQLLLLAHEDEIRICSGWLLAEIQALEPLAIVALGATAAQAFMGKTFKVSQHKGEVCSTWWAERFVATHHPAATLRRDGESARDAARAELAGDIARACAGVVIPAQTR